MEPVQSFWSVVAVLAFAVIVTVAATSMMRISMPAVLVGMAGLLGLLALAAIAALGATGWAGKSRRGSKLR